MNFLCGDGYGIVKPVPAPPRRPVAIPRGVSEYSEELSVGEIGKCGVRKKNVF